VSIKANAARAKRPAEDVFASDVLSGLSAPRKSLAPKYFYDERGSQLFEQITELEEYYPTRCELAILREHKADIARVFGPKTALIEFGTGSTRKVRILLEAATTVEAYVPVDISAEMLRQEAQQLQHDYPRLRVLPVAADITLPFRLPSAIVGLARAGFFPGSTIGNFEPHDAVAFLRNAARILGARAPLIVGIDLVKDVRILNAAYDDAQGVTAQFNLNVLTRLNRELGADFDLDAFSHRAFYNSERRRVEMHLVSGRPQKVNIAGRVIEFAAGETIHTENSYKYTIESFGLLARSTGWTPLDSWTDGYFLVQSLAARA
jgi:dimethylhistidine N-methyltransferase